ncbi:hypothetical protein [Rubrolithibacter danxiaensis]|uniref:hypothetical protein n=1 Tax=Rubrolithibacter danxiaensis TaxID=3390805 RepID=UPI003BF918C1
MADINLTMGVFCPKCNLTIGTYAAVGSNTNCPGCGGPIIAAPSGKTKVISNFKCECGMQIGHLSIVGEKACCPNCGKEI